MHPLESESVRKVSHRAIENGIHIRPKHMTEKLRQLAVWYLNEYNGVFSFMNDVQRRLIFQGPESLTDGQLAGVLNCMVRDFALYHDIGQEQHRVDHLLNQDHSMKAGERCHVPAQRRIFLMPMSMDLDLNNPLWSAGSDDDGTGYREVII